MNALELAAVFDEKYTLPLAHEAAEMLRDQHNTIHLALQYLQIGSKIDVAIAIEVLEGAL